jgi:hypothetical protein
MSNQKNKDVVLLVEDAKQHGKTMIVPIAGAIEIDTDGKFTIDDVTATLLLNSGSGFKLVEGNGTTVTDSGNTDGDSDEDDSDNEDSDDSDDSDEEEDEEDGDGLDELSLEELIGIASESFEEKKYKKFMKSEKMMIQFLRKNS